MQCKCGRAGILPVPIPESATGVQCKCPQCGKSAVATGRDREEAYQKLRAKMLEN